MVNYYKIMIFAEFIFSQSIKLRLVKEEDFYLKQDKVDEEEKETRATEPEKTVIWMNNRITFYHISHFLNL